MHLSRVSVRRAAVIAAAAFAVTLPGSARAGGALSSLVSGMKKKAGSDDDSSRGASGDDDSDHRDDGYMPGPADGPDWIDPNHAVDPPVFWTGPYPTSAQGGDVAIYAALQSVRDSDGSLTVAVQSSYGPFGVAAANTRYFERQDGPGEDGSLLTLDMWSISAAYRVTAFGEHERTAVWLRGGLAGAAANGLSAIGIAAGAHAAHNFTPSLGLDMEARALVLQHGIQGYEWRAGAAASFLRLSYRVLALDAGPPLRGPEVGVSFAF